MANEKLLQTRISLKYDTYANWTNTSKADAGANLVLKKGEVGFCEIPAGNATATNAPTVLFKVGDGTRKFSELNWASALAADVHAWAKKSEAEFLTWVKGLVPIEVIDNGTGKFVTDVTATSDANGHHITITRADVAWGDITDKPNLVNSVKTTDDDIVVLTPETAASGDVTITGAHAKKGPSAGYTGSTNIKGGTAVVGTELDIKVPVLTVDAYGHTNAVNEASYKITIPKATAPNDGELTLKAGNGLTATEKVFTANDPNNVTFEVSHANTSDAANLVADGRKYVTGLTFDDYGHVTGYTTGTEVDQDLSHNHDAQYKKLQSAYTKEATGAFEVVSKVEQNANGEVTVGTKTLDLSGYQEKGNYKTVQTAIDDKGLTGANVLGSLSQDANGVITYTTRALTAADLGLDTVMHFVGAYATAPTKAFVGTSKERDLDDGDVYLNTANATEYVYSGGKWYELGNESAAGSHALKTISITGTGYLTGGGTLEANRTIDLTQATKEAIDEAFNTLEVTEYTSDDGERHTVDVEFKVKDGTARDAIEFADGDYIKITKGSNPSEIAVDLQDSVKTSLEKADKSLNAENLYINDDCAPEDNFWGVGLYNNDGGDYIGTFGFTTEDGIEVRQETAHDCKVGLSETIKASLGKADTAIQSAKFAGTAFTKTGTELSISQADARTALGLGTAAYKAEGDFATKAQGEKADKTAETLDALLDYTTGTSLKIGTGEYRTNVAYVDLTGPNYQNNNSERATYGEVYFGAGDGLQVALTEKIGDISLIEYSVTEAVRNGAAKGATSIQSVAAAPNGGLKVTSQSDDGKDIDIEIDDTITWIFDCGGAGV